MSRDHIGAAGPFAAPRAAGHASPLPVGSREAGNVFDPLLLDPSSLARPLDCGVSGHEAGGLFTPTCGCPAAISCGVSRGINVWREGVESLIH